MHAPEISQRLATALGQFSWHQHSCEHSCEATPVPVQYNSGHHGSILLKFLSDLIGDG